MIPVSVVIITKNEAHVIASTLQSVKGLTDDIIVVDSGSTDGTQEVAKAFGATVINTSWDGFGPNKNKGIAAAKNDWILSIDADEQPDAELVRSIQSIDHANPSIAYNIRFKTFLGKALIRFGEWGKDAHIRLFHRSKINWNEAAVHEELIIPNEVAIKTLGGHILHFTMKDLADYSTKMTKYALLYAERSFNSGKKASWIKRTLSPTFSFIQNYVFRLGFLDGGEGYLIAKMTSYYTFLKYARLHELNKSLKQK